MLDRVEKERNQLKSELDDLQGQLDHVSKTKVGEPHGSVESNRTDMGQSHDYCCLEHRSSNNNDEMT